MTNLSDLTRIVRDYIAASPDLNLPTEVQIQAKHHILDTFAAMISGSNEVLAVWIWIYWQAGRIPEAAAIGVMLILITAVMGLAARKLVGESLSGPRH